MSLARITSMTTIPFCHENPISVAIEISELKSDELNRKLQKYTAAKTEDFPKTHFRKVTGFRTSCKIPGFFFTEAEIIPVVERRVCKKRNHRVITCRGTRMISCSRGGFQKSIFFACSNEIDLDLLSKIFSELYRWRRRLDFGKFKHWMGSNFNPRLGFCSRPDFF